ncbi:MAG: hypothetical protein AAGC74_09255 [Verrucomicrobiota bacterium]
MKYAALILVVAATLVGVASQTMRGSTGPEFSLAELAIAILSIPALVVSGIATIAGLGGSIFAKRHRAQSAVFAGIGVIVPGLMLAKKFEHESNFEASYAWFDQLSGAGQLNFYVHELLQEDSDWITYIDDSELIDPQPIVERLREDLPLLIKDHSGRKRQLVVGAEGIETPWGSVIYFAVDRDGDGFVSALGQRTSTRYGVSDPWTSDPDYSYRHASGVLLHLPDTELSGVALSLVTLDDNDYERLRESWRSQRK